MFSCSYHKAAKSWASFWTVLFQTELVNLKENGLPIFSYIDITYTIWEKIVWYLWMEWKRLRCSLQGEGGQDCRNVKYPFKRVRNLNSENLSVSFICSQVPDTCTRGI